MKRYVRDIRGILFAILVILGTMTNGKCKVQATSASITLGAMTESVQVGDLFSVSVTLKGSNKIGEVSAKVKYDTDRLQFSSENSMYSEADGEITITDTGTEASNIKKYVLQFRANEAKTARIWIEGTPSVYDANGNVLSLSKNVLQVSIGEKTEKSSNKNLSALSIKEGKLDQSFTGSHTNYTMTVSNEVKKLTITAAPEEAKAKVEIKGAEKLLVGENKVVITVTSETRRTKEYTITVTRSGDVLGNGAPVSSPVQTMEPEQEKIEQIPPQATPTSTPSAEDTADSLEKYEFVSVENMRTVPEGYLSVGLAIGGKNVDAYQLENQKEKDVYLVYAKYDGGAGAFYLYDQKEGTIQKYRKEQTQSVDTSNMISIEEYNDRVEIFGTIVGVCAGIITLLSVLLVHMYKKSKRHERELD